MARDRIIRPRVAKADADFDAEGMSEYMLKARGVQTAILAPPSVPAEKQKSFESNGDSHFMRLPAELRNRIYSLLLSGNTIHVSGHNSNRHDMRLTLKRKLTRSVCKHHEHGEGDTAQIQDDQPSNSVAGQASFRSFATRHSSCMAETSEPFNLSILRTSRQIHSEAALLFYQENTFTFDNIVNLEAFLAFLIPAQVKAVQSIEFIYHYFTSNEAFEKLLQSKLGTLNSLVIHLEGDMRGIDPASPVFLCLSRFQRLSIKSAKVESDTLDVTLKKSIEERLEKEWVDEPERKFKNKRDKDAAEPTRRQPSRRASRKLSLLEDDETNE